MAESPILFCPFCREGFEGVTTCPDHELPLVSIDKLKGSSEEDEAASEEAFLDLVDPRFGRGLAAAGALGTFIGFLLPLASRQDVDMSTAWSALEVATHEAPALWTVPFSGAIVFGVLMRRRTRALLRSARLVMALVGVMPIVTLAYALTRLFRGAEILGRALEERYGMPRLLELRVEWGAYVIGCASIAMIAGAFMLGGSPPRELPPSGSVPGSEL